LREALAEITPRLERFPRVEERLLVERFEAVCGGSEIPR